MNSFADVSRLTKRRTILAEHPEIFSCVRQLTACVQIKQMRKTQMKHQKMVLLLLALIVSLTTAQQARSQTAPSGCAPAGRWLEKLSGLRVIEPSFGVSFGFSSSV